MQRIGVRELRQNASVYLDLVKSGQTVEVTERGTLVALLTPPTPASGEREVLIKAGCLIPAARPSGRLRIRTPVESEPDAPTNQQLLESERDERL